MGLFSNREAGPDNSAVQSLWAVPTHAGGYGADTSAFGRAAVVEAETVIRTTLANIVGPNLSSRLFSQEYPEGVEPVAHLLQGDEQLLIREITLSALNRRHHIPPTPEDKTFIG